MRVIYDLGASESCEPAVLTLGFFDGVHLGHRWLIERAAELARQQHVSAVAVTFWPHPRDVLHPEETVPLLTTLSEKLDLLSAAGSLDAALVVPFTPELAALDPDAFLNYLSRRYEPRALVEGEDFTFGRRRAGDLAFLRAAGAQRGFAVESLDMRVDDQRVSSSRIRTLVREGQAEAATRLLGRPYILTGEVIAGDRRGRLLGFPTANLRLDPRKLLPGNGVYAVRVRLPGEAQAHHPGVANIGVRPTFGGDPQQLVEIHLLDGSMDLYSLTITVELIARLRPEQRFDGVAALKAQIALDAHQARALLVADPAGAGTPDQG